MATPGLRNIKIGRDRWIKVVDVAGRQNRAVYIDFLIHQIQPFWDVLATVCVPDCCGIDAFGLYPAEIGRASQVMKEDELRDALDSLLLFVRQSPSDIFVSRLLNNYFDRSVLLELIDHLQYNVDGPRGAFEKESPDSRPLESNDPRQARDDGF